MIVGHEDRVTPWSSFRHHGCARVRVWQRQTPFGFFQRHEWEREDGSIHADDWIPTPMRRFDLRATPADDPHDPTSALVDALRRIAAGHNDPRTLALETLTLIGSQS